MSNNEEDISKVHEYLRNSKIFAPLKLIYAQFVSIARFGVKYEYFKIYYGIKRRISQRRFHKKIFISAEERERQKTLKYTDKVKFSILVPLYNTPENFLREMIESVQQQTYTDWELCLADGSDDKHSYVGDIVREYADKDSRIVYKVLESNGGISENTNVCIEMSTGNYIVLFDHDDLLHESALYEIRSAIDKQKADFIYTDEAIFSKDYTRPDSYHLKQDFAIDDIRSNNYICHISCFSKKLLDQVGGFRKEYDGSQDFDLILRLTEKAERIVHIPKVLYFWRCHELSVASDISAKTYCIDAGINAVKSHFEREGIKAKVESSAAYPVIYRVTYEIVGHPKVSVIITNQFDEVSECKNSIQKYTAYDNYEILICDDIKHRNIIASKASGEYLVFVNDGCRCEHEEWMQELLSIAQRDDIGVAGPKVVYPNETIRDVGITLGMGINKIGSNDFYRVNADNLGYLGNMYFTHNKSAVVDCGCMIAKSKFEKIQGFDTELPEWYAGIDISLKMLEAGYLNAINPYAELRFGHKEKHRDMIGNYKKSKAYENVLQDRWHDVLDAEDRYYNANLTKDTGNYSIG